MASNTKQTTTIRTRKTRAAGKARKRKQQRDGTTKSAEALFEPSNPPAPR